MDKFRYSKQRERILEMLKSTDIHPTADWIYDKLKKEFPDLSMGTVYRNLNILYEQGLIKRIDFGKTFDRFDANIIDHYHFICEKCGAIIDLKIPIDNSLNDKVTENTGYSTKSHKIQFYGICDKCR